MNAEFEAYCARLKAKHGAKFSASGLSGKFAPYYGRAWHLKVRFPCGTEKWGYVGGTTGWGPSLMLLHWNAHGSSWLLDDRCEILIKRRRTA